MIDDALISDRDDGFVPAAWADEIWDQCAAGLCLVDEAGLIVRGNEEFAKCLGRSVRALEGRSIVELHPADSRSAMMAVHNAIFDGQPESDWASKEMGFIHTNGRPVVVFARNRKIEREGEKPLRLITILEMSQLGRDDDLAEQVHRAKNFAALAGVIANDINNLLSIVLGYTALLHDPKAEAGRIKIVAEGVDGAVARASTLVRQTLYLARRPDPVLKVVDFTRFVEHTIGSLRGSMANRPIETDISLSRKLSAVQLDPGQMTDALGEIFELIKMAEPKASWPLKVTTRLTEGAKVRDRFGDADAGDYAVLEIMHPAQPRAASRAPFASQPPAEPKQGLDLGMTMVERILDGHRGFLGRELLTGQGLVFSVYLPLTPEQKILEEPSVDTPDQTDADQEKKHTVLIVDDEPGLVDMIEMALKRRGYHVLTASTGEEAVAIFNRKSTKIDLAILDLVLPKISGWEVFDQLRQTNPNVQVLIMSGHMEPKLRTAVSRSGAKGFIQKPFSMTMFCRRVAEVFA